MEKFTITQPEYSDWKCYLFGSDEKNGIVYRPIKGQAPNFFVRYMSNLVLGCKWIKIKEKDLR